MSVCPACLGTKGYGDIVEGWTPCEVCAGTGVWFVGAEVSKLSASARWTIGVYAAASRDFGDALDLIRDIPEQTFKTDAGPVDPVEALEQLLAMVTAHAKAKTDKELNDLLAGPTKRRLAELRPDLEDFVGLRTITAIYSGGILCIDGKYYRFYVADEYGMDEASKRSVRRTWLRTIRRLSNEELHTADLVVVLTPTVIVIEMRLFKHEGSKILYGVDEKTDRLILEVGDIQHPTMFTGSTLRNPAKVPLTEYVFKCDPDGLKETVRPIVDDRIDVLQTTG